MIEIKKCAKLPAVNYEPNPPFGSVFAPHILRMELTAGGPNTYAAEIKKYEAELMYPTLAGLHYGQTVFEGMKAFLQKDGSAGVFRADLHAKRFRQSAKRMGMAEVPEEVFLHCIKEYVSFVADNVPHEAGHSLYLRPLLIAADNKLKVGSSHKFIFYIMSSIAGKYFTGKTNEVRPARVLVNPEFVRAFPGGLGEIKTAANYAASIMPQKIASQYECDQVLFLDAVHHNYIDELGGMNFFAIRGDELLTPALNGAILHGVTRRSILDLAADLNLKPIETQISFKDLCAQIESGVIKECFACGTAAVVSPIGEFMFQEKIGATPRSITLKGKPDVSLKILDRLSKIQRGEIAAPGPWILNCK